MEFKSKIAATGNSDTRKVDISLFAQSVLQFVPVIPLYHERLSLTYRTDNRNLDIDPRGFVLFEDLWITPAKIMNMINIENP